MEDKFIVLEFMKANFQMEIQLVGVEQFILMEDILLVNIITTLLKKLNLSIKMEIKFMKRFTASINDI
jgi:hypothetical protein